MKSVLHLWDFFKINRITSSHIYWLSFIFYSFSFILPEILDSQSMKNKRKEQHLVLSTGWPCRRWQSVLSWWLHGLCITNNAICHIVVNISSWFVIIYYDAQYTQ
jgi:hypothetical protein